MIAGVRLCDGSVLTALLPVKLAGVNNNTAERCSVTADELCSRVYYNVCAMLDRTDKVRSTECIVYYKRKSVLVCYLCDSVNVGDIAVGVAERFKVDSLCIILNSVFDFFKVMCVYKCSADAVLGKRMCKQVVAAAVDCLLCYDMLTCVSESLNSVSYSGCARCCSECGNTALKSGNSVSKAPCVEFVSLP